ncbi:MAG: hypothetical protein ACREIQ_00440 [Nitrospiria bacterium]
MKITAFVTAASLFILVPTSPTWAFGPHSTSTTSEGIELPHSIIAIQNYTAPIFYLSLTRRDVIDLSKGQEVIEVEGISAKTRIVIPLGNFFGLSFLADPSLDVMDRSIEKAITDAKNRYGVQTLYDVRIDRHLFSILGIYQKTSTIIHAKGIK